MTKAYFEPVALLYGDAAREAVANGGALPLAGGPIAFGAVRIWEGTPGAITHAIARTATLQAIDDSAVVAGLAKLTARRPALCGLSLDMPRVVGIVNVTPDSFSDGGQFTDATRAIEHAKHLGEEGADLLDIGGESTRPGAETVATDAELSRVLPVLEGLRNTGKPVSIDTRKPEVAEAAKAAGAAIWNDVSGLTYSARSMEEAARLGIPVVIMHGGRDPKTMQDAPSYRDVVVEVYDFLDAQIEAAVAAGIPRESIIADPGFGFAKTAEHNLALLRSLGLFHGLGVPILTGLSRKATIGKLTGVADAKDRVIGSVAAASHAARVGVQLHRVHDVKATREAFAVLAATL
jgi:dihydropteroate synthase